MQKQKIGGLALLMLASVFSFSMLSAEEQPMKERFKDLNLSQEQKDQLKNQHQSFVKVKKDLMQKSKKDHEDLISEIKKEHPDKQKIEAIKLRLQDFQKQMIDMRVKHLLDLKEVLSPEQFNKLLTHQRKQMERHQKSPEAMEP